MIEDELRSLLRSRVAAPPDDPARIASVHARITRTRRLRAAGGAFALVLLALASLFVLRLPGTNESLPPGAPKPPFFKENGQVRTDLPRFSENGGLSGFRSGTFTWQYDGAEDNFANLLAVRCEAYGDLSIVSAMRTVTVPCRTEVGGHYEGAVELPAGEGTWLFGLPSAPSVVTVSTSSPGLWTLAVVEARAPVRLVDDVGGNSPHLFDGRRARDGETRDVRVWSGQRDTAPPEFGVGFPVIVDCVAGVRLTFRVPQGELGTAFCDPDTMEHGSVNFSVPEETMRRLGLRYDQQVRLTVVRSGTETDQWRVGAIG